MKRLLMVVALTATLGLFPATASANHGRGHEKGNPHARHYERDRRGWERRGDFEVRIYGAREGYPPGWSRGRKAGWGNCGMPPGLAKKYGCRTYDYEGRPYYYYRDEVGRIVVRRPYIEIRAVIR